MFGRPRVRTLPPCPRRPVPSPTLFRGSRIRVPPHPLVTAFIRSSLSIVNGPTPVCGSAPGLVLSCLLRRGGAAYKSLVVKSYRYQRTTLGQFQLIAQVHNSAASARTGAFRVFKTSQRNPTRRTLSLNPQGKGSRTLRPPSTIRWLKSGMLSICPLDQGDARSKNCIVTITRRSASATHRNTSLFLLTLPALYTSAIAFDLYVNTGLDSTARAQHSLYSFHDVRVAKYKRVYSFVETKKNSRLCRPTK